MYIDADNHHSVNAYIHCDNNPTSKTGGYIKIDGALSYTDALYRVSKGYDVFTYNGTFAYWLARSAGGGKIPVGPEIDKGKVGTVGYYWHYHTYDRNGAHVFYLW